MLSLLSLSVQLFVIENLSFRFNGDKYFSNKDFSILFLFVCFIFFLYFLFVSERQVSYHTMHGNFFVFFFRDSKGEKIFVRFVCEHVATESKNIYIQFAQRKSLFKATQFERKFYVLFCCKYRNMLRDQPSKNSKKKMWLYRRQQTKMSNFRSCRRIKYSLFFLAELLTFEIHIGSHRF